MRETGVGIQKATERENGVNDYFFCCYFCVFLMQ